MLLEPLAHLIDSVHLWGVLLLVAAVAACAPLGHWFATRRGPAALAVVPATLALGALLMTNELHAKPAATGHPATITATLGVPVIVGRSHSPGFAGDARPTVTAVGAASVLGAFFLVAMWRGGRPRQAIHVDAAGMTWWPVRRHGPRLVSTFAVLVLLASWLLTHTITGSRIPAFRPAVVVGPLEAMSLAGLALLAVLAWAAGGPAFRRVRLTSDAVLLERADGGTVPIALLDLAYAELDLPGLVAQRSLVLHVGQAGVRRTHIVCADGSSDEEVEQVRTAIMDARIRVSARPTEVPEPPSELLALRRGPAVRTIRAASER